MGERWHVVTRQREDCETLVGREPELDRIDAFLRNGFVHGGCLVLTGLVGQGKSALLHAATRMAGTSGVTTVEACGVEFEGELHFAGLHQVLHGLLPGIDDLTSPLRGALLVALGYDVGSPPSVLTVSNATLALLTQSKTGVLVALDDVHWLDRSSATVLSVLARRLTGTKVAMMATTRPQPSFFDPTGLNHLAVGPLDSGHSTVLLRSAYPDLAPRSAEAVLDQAQGNPLALLELPPALGESSPVLGRPTTLPVSSRLRVVLESRIGRLPPPTKELLLLAALDGTGDLLALDPEGRARGTSAAVAAAEDAQLVNLDVRHRLVFRHPLVRSVVVSLATSEQRRMAHTRLASMMEAYPERRAWHLAEATLGVDETVAAALEQAARRSLGRGDGVGSVKALLRAADLSPAPPDRARRLSEAAYIGADVTGDLAGVVALVEEARRAQPAAEPLSLETAVAAAYGMLNGDGDIDSAERILVGAIDGHIGRDAGDPTLVEALLTLLSVCLWSVDPDRYATYQALVHRLHSELREDLHLETALIADPVRTAIPVLPELDRAIAELATERDLVRIDRVARAGIYVDRTDQCREPLWRVVTDARAGGAVAKGVNALTYLCVDDLQAGRWDQVLELSDEGLRLCETHGYVLPSWPFLLTKGIVAAARGDYAQAEMLADRTLQWATPRHIGGIQNFGWHVRGMAALTAGSYDAAFRSLVRIHPPGVLPHLLAYALLVAFDLTEAAARSGRRGEAGRHALALDFAGTAAISPRQTFIASGCAALAAEGRGDDLFAQVLAFPQADRWPFELARLRLVYGERLRRARARAESRTQLTAAMEGFRALGAEPWVQRAATELRAAGVPGRGHPKPGALTAQELQVASMAASGLTNKEIGVALSLSHRTIGAHLRNVFTKLGITTRAALRDALASRDEPLS